MSSHNITVTLLGKKVGRVSALAFLLCLRCYTDALPFANASDAPSNTPVFQGPLINHVSTSSPSTSLSALLVPSLWPSSELTLSTFPPTHVPSTNTPSPGPSNSPITNLPSALPSQAASNAPSDLPTNLPSAFPTEGPTTPKPSQLPTTLSPSKPPTCNLYDKFGVEMIYRDDPYKENWDSSSWYTETSRTITSPIIKADPFDPRVEVRGTGAVVFENGEATLSKSPYLYIKESGRSDRSGWVDVEFTAYGKFAYDANPKTNGGINIQLRSDHGLVSTGDGCDAQFYWAQITHEGQASFIKELYHDDETLVRSNKISIDIDEFSSGLPIDEWIGVKFIAFNTGGVNVRLELYIDTSGRNNQWKRVASYKDRPGQWNTTKPVPSTCSQKEGDTILGPSRYCALFNVGRDESTQVTWKDVSVRNIIPEPLTEICERPSSSPSKDPTRAPTPASQTIAPTVAPQSNVPTMAPQTSTPSAKPSSTPTHTRSEEPSIALSHVPSQNPTRYPVVEISKNPNLGASLIPSEIPSLDLVPSASHSLPQMLVVSINAMAEIFFPGIDELMMSESEIEQFEETTVAWLQESSIDTLFAISSVEVIGQEVVFSTIQDFTTRRLRRSLEVQGMTALAVTISVAAETNVQEGDETPSLSAFVDDAIISDSQGLRDELLHVVSLFAIEEPPLNGRGVKGDKGKNIGAIVGSVLVVMLFVVTVVAAVSYRRVSCTKIPLAEIEEFSCSSSSVGSASLFSSGANHPMKDQTKMGTNVAACDDRLYPVQELASQEPRNLLSDDAESIGSGCSISDCSELYAMSSIGVSTDAGDRERGSDAGTGLMESTATDQDLEEELIPPSSIAHHLYPIISVSESGESISITEEEGTVGKADKRSGNSPSLKDDNSIDTRMHRQKKSIEMLFNNSETKDNEVDDNDDDDDDDDEDSLCSGDESEVAEDEHTETSTDAAKKGSPIKTMFSCFQPQTPADGLQPSTLASSSIMSVGSTSSKSSPPNASPIRKPTEQYEIRAPPGSLGMVVVTSREGPRVYHVKDESPLANIIEEGDIILGIDSHDTTRMTATSLRRFLRSRDARAERVITIRGRKRKGRHGVEQWRIFAMSKCNRITRIRTIRTKLFNIK